MGRSKKSFDRVLSMYKHRRLAFKATHWPIIGTIGKKIIDNENLTLTYIPINSEINLPQGSPVPTQIIEHFINEAGHHLILSRCPCRSENKCEHYPHDFACTFLGKAVLDVDPQVGRLVSREEALEHLHKSNEMGLVSAVGAFKGDAIMLGVKDHHHLMTICHCCPCCCISNCMPIAAKEARDKLIRLEGLRVIINDECNGCGLCEKECIFDAISIVNKKAVVSEECKGCGRCASVCKKNAIEIIVDNPDFFDLCIKRINEKVDVT